MKSEYKFNFSRKVIWLGMLQIIAAALLGFFIYTIYEGDYLAVWFSSVVVALVLLLMLSIPRRIVVTPTKVEIRCIMEIREIKISEIVSIHRVNPRIIRWVVPLFAGHNFFGYYGTYFDIRRIDRFKIYATEWKHLVEIVDVYDERLYLSCREGEALIKEITSLQHPNDSL